MSQLIAGAELNDLAQVHDRDIGAEMQHGSEVVSNEEVTQAELLLQVLQQIHDLGADGDVQRRDRLIEHNQTWVQR